MRDLPVGVGEHALQPEHQGIANLPLWARALPAGLELGDRVVERTAPCRARCEHLRGVFALVKGKLAKERGFVL